MRGKKLIRRGLWVLLFIFLLMNAIAFFHSYKFTHFSRTTSTRSAQPKEMSPLQKFKTLIFGVNNPRPESERKPATTFETIRLKSNKEIECWSIKNDSAKGTVILFHGFGGQKAMMLDKEELFRSMGFNTFLVDFMGAGGSEGNQTTIGYKESAQVKTAFDFVKSNGEKNIFLFGTSMGAVAIMKSVSEGEILPTAIIIECPFGSMYKTVCARFRSMNAPIFPMAGLLLFWGGVQNGFWAFAHNPEEYAKKISVPTLLLYGIMDEKVSLEETQNIYNNLQGEKELKMYSQAGHDNYLLHHKDEWISDISGFINR